MGSPAAATAAGSHAERLDRLMPVWDVSDAVAIRTAADPDAAWRALASVDLIALGRKRPQVGVLGAMRMVPELVRGLATGQGLPDGPGGPVTLAALADGSGDEGDWVLLEEGERSISLGLVGKFWRPVIAYAPVTAESFESFDDPGFAKTVYALSATPLDGGGALLRGEMRTAATDEAARRWFFRYWTLGVGPGAHVLVRALLERAREVAEQCSP